MPYVSPPFFNNSTNFYSFLGCDKNVSLTREKYMLFRERTENPNILWKDLRTSQESWASVLLDLSALHPSGVPRRGWMDVCSQRPLNYVQICQKSRRIGCVIPRCKLHCSTTQPIWDFLTYLYYYALRTLGLLENIKYRDRRTKRWALGCEKFLLDPAWLLLNKTGPPFSRSL